MKNEIGNKTKFQEESSRVVSTKRIPKNTFFGSVSIISFNVTLSGRGSPICLKPYLSHNSFLSSALSAGEGATGTATARITFVFLKEIEHLLCLVLILFNPSEVIPA